MALWGGRFSEPADEALRRLNDSIGFDKRMYKQDITASIAYAKALVTAGILTQEESQQIIEGLYLVLAEFEQGTFVFVAADEDIHTAVERRLTELVGSLGGKLHTGRSRNDQVATDLRLWVLDALQRLDEMLRGLQMALVQQAEQHVETLMPGYTHFQPAQPISAAHWLLSFFWMIQRDRDRLADTGNRTSIMPLGSGALAGTPLRVDRDALARELGFASYSQNSLDSVSDRDFVAETLFTLALCGTHLSRLAEDILTYSNPALGFISLNDRYSTGSSLMPQKRNADPMELTRGKTGRMIGQLTGLLATLKGLPSGYNKDLQEDKESLFDVVDSHELLIPVVTAVIRTLQINPVRMYAALSDDMLATDLADYLVSKGLPFREAHHLVGQVVRMAEQRNGNLADITISELREVSAVFDEEATHIFDFMRSVKQREADGGTAPEAVWRQISAAKKHLA